MGVNVDEELANGRNGIYTFHAQGAFYHRIGSLLPLPGMKPRFLQLYIYETNNEIDNRIVGNENLEWDVVQNMTYS